MPKRRAVAKGIRSHRIDADTKLSDTQTEVLAITACRQNHLSGEHMCAQCFAIERAILRALKLQGEIINA
jgi:hypothetical protein